MKTLLRLLPLLVVSLCVTPIFAQPSEADMKKMKAQAKLMPTMMKMFIIIQAEGKGLGMTFVEDGDDTDFQKLTGTTNEQFGEFYNFMMDLKSTVKPQMEPLMLAAADTDDPAKIEEIGNKIESLLGGVYDQVSAKLEDTVTPQQMMKLRQLELQMTGPMTEAGFLNQRFGDDLQFPIYVIRAPTEGDNVFMSISGGAESLWYRDEIADWQGGGYLIRVHKNRSDRVGFNTALLHELSHAFHPFLSTPWPHAIPGMNIPSRPGIQGSLSVYWDHVFHKADFWRLCFHVWKRATLAGFDCRHARLGFSWVDFDAMREVIENETVELLDTPLWKIAKRPIP